VTLIEEEETQVVSLAVLPKRNWSTVKGGRIDLSVNCIGNILNLDHHNPEDEPLLEKQVLLVCPLLN
jgi:hypothetical protein